MPNKIDLHMHSTASDGTDTPLQLAEIVQSAGITIFALTDHDTTDGIAEALAAAGEYNRKLADGTLPPLSSGICPRPLEVIPGIEFSTEYEGREVHILGLDIRPEQEDFARHLDFFQKSRENRNEEMARLLRQKAGFDIL